ncbi:MAG: AI-2E family transporter YdiK [Gemmatimonadota bacterium]|jgi:predicted PurR-regulated permease PerM|nr:AI-2E family transporter YdiK [Gemmatimonadota bacterium]
MTSPNAPTGDTGETIRRLLATLLIMLLAVASLWLLAPFLPAIIWAGTIAIATWPILLYLTRQFGGRRGLAVTVMTLAILICFLFPILGLVAVVVDHASDVGRLATAISASGLPDAPAWVASIPLVGSKVAARWHELALLRGDEVIEQASPWLSQVSGWLLSKAGGLALMVLQILLTAIVAALLFGSGEQVAAGIRTFARRLGGDRADEVVILAAKAVRGVALGVVVTALAQSVIGGLALVATGVPAAGLLTAIIFFLCLAQVGPLLVMAPAVAWLYWSGHSVAGIILLVVTIFVVVLDNVLRPMLIKKGADLPLLLVFTGVIGGMLVAGVLGIFVGPVILAVTYTLLAAWVAPAEAKP